MVIKDYIDDGVPGALLDRPLSVSCERTRRGDVYDVVSFLDANRIARVVAYQTIIIEELLKCGKQIIISGKDYADRWSNC